MKKPEVTVLSDTCSRAHGGISELLGSLDTLDPVSVDAASFSIPDKDEKDIFAARKAWNNKGEARCDFKLKPRITRRGGVWFLSLWNKSLMGRTLTDIKSDDNEIIRFSNNIAMFLREIFGDELSAEAASWCIVTTPCRRHTQRNFACLTAQRIADILKIEYVPDCARCRSKHSVNAVFDPVNIPQKQNVIVFDDIVTTGSTMRAMSDMLKGLGKNTLLIAGINNAA